MWGGGGGGGVTYKRPIAVGVVSIQTVYSRFHLVNRRWCQLPRLPHLCPGQPAVPLPPTQLRLE